jgi:hypothetical protein
VARGSDSGSFIFEIGAEEGTRTPTPLRVHGPEPCASANSATSARMKSSSDGWTDSPISVAKALPGVKLAYIEPPASTLSRKADLYLCISAIPAQPTCRPTLPAISASIMITFIVQKDTPPGMIDTQPNNVPSGSEPDESRIPSQVAEQIRRLSHDLSNALEVILQTNYLLGMTAAGEGSIEDYQKWREMLDKGILQATQINRQLRDYVRSHS